MSVRIIGQACSTTGCHRPVWMDDQCSSCWRLARIAGGVCELGPAEGWTIVDECEQILREAA